jgi:hypothetical protein
MKGADILSTLIKPHDALRIMWYLERECKHLRKGHVLSPDTGSARVDICFYPTRWLSERKIDPRTLTECAMLTSEFGKVRYFVTKEPVNPLIKRGGGEERIQCVCFLV